MPAPQLATAIIEDAINRLLALDEQSLHRIKPLSGKQLQVQLTEFPFDFLFCFNDSIDVLSVPRETSAENSSTSAKVDIVDCYIAASVFTLPELRNVSNITTLIKEDKLQLVGDIQLAQQFSQLFKSLDIDWEEQLSKHTGDIVAHQVSALGKKLFNNLQRVISDTSIALRDAAIEEKKVAAPKTLVEQFNDDVFDLQGKVRQLENRIRNLEAKQ